MPQTSIWFSDENYQWLVEQAESDDTSKADVINTLIEQEAEA